MTRASERDADPVASVLAAIRALGDGPEPAPDDRLRAFLAGLAGGAPVTAAEPPEEPPQERRPLPSPRTDGTA